MVVPLGPGPDILQEPESHQRRPQRRGAGELDRAKPEVGGRVDVRRGVVDEDRFLSFDAEPLCEVFEDPPVGLFTPTSPEMTIPSNHARKSNRSSATGNISADQLLSATSRTPAARSSASTSTVPGISPASISGHRRWNASISSRRSGCSATRISMASARVDPRPGAHSTPPSSPRQGTTPSRPGRRTAACTSGADPSRSERPRDRRRP